MPTNIRTIRENAALGATPAADDSIPIWDESEGEYKRVVYSDLLGDGGLVTGGGTVDTQGFTLSFPASGIAALRSGSPTTGRVARWANGNTVEDAGFAATDVARLSTAQTFSALKTFSAGISLGDDTLARYVQGTLWTPAITGSGTNPSVAYSTQYGIYARIGSLVFISIHLQLTSISGGSGTVRIEMPFPTITNIQTRMSLQTSQVTYSGTPISIVLNISGGSVNGGITSIYNNGTATALPISGLANNSQIIASGAYLTSTA